MESWNTPLPHPLPVQPDRLVLHDTSTGQMRHPGNGAEASMYVCGITPYDATHLGHANTYLAFDMLNRYWRACGLQVQYVQNVTDVDDPLFERAAQTGVDWMELATEQTELFRSDMQALNVLAPGHFVAASETVDWVVEAVTTLLRQGTAYRLEDTAGGARGDIYFSVEAAQYQTDWRLGSIGALSLQEMTEVFPDRGGDPERPGKRHRLDPPLWWAARQGQPAWEGGGLGPGRPGWHVECSAIARRLLPEPFTVQGGGSDLRFPHHEYSAAHATAVDGQPLALTYVHAGMVGLNGEKMSKSQGNLELVSRLRQAGADPAAIRAGLLSHHYREDWSWSEEQLREATARLARWRTALATEKPDDGMTLLREVHAELSADLDTPAALRAVDAWAERAAARTERPEAVDATAEGAVHGGQLGGESEDRLVGPGTTDVRTTVTSLLGVRL